eukprot:IDg675t1
MHSTGVQRFQLPPLRFFENVLAHFACSIRFQNFGAVPVHNFAQWGWQLRCSQMISIQAPVFPEIAFSPFEHAWLHQSASYALQHVSLLGACSHTSIYFFHISRSVFTSLIQTSKTNSNAFPNENRRLQTIPIPNFDDAGFEPSRGCAVRIKTRGRCDACVALGDE